MASQKLTNQMRDSIAKNETDRAFCTIETEMENGIQKEVEALHKEEYPTAYKLTEEERNRWFSRSVRVEIRGRVNRFSIKDSLPVPYHDSFIELVRSTENLDSLLAEQIKVKTEKTSFRNKLISILQSCNTEKQLIELIPELKKYFPESVKNSGVIVPISLIDDVRQMLKK